MANSPQNNPFDPNPTLDAINILSYGSGTLINATDAINHAVAQITSANKNPVQKGAIYFPPRTYTLSTSCTVPAGVRLIFEYGAILSVASGKTLTIAGQVDAGRWQIFGGSGTTTLTGTLDIFPEWFGAVGDGTTNDANALTNALANGGRVMGLAGKTYRIATAVPMVSNTLFDLNGATLLQDAAVNVLTATGSIGSKTNLPSNHAAGADTVAVATSDGTNWSAGDLIILESQDIVTTGAALNIYAKEIHKVVSISGDTLTIEGALDFAYNTAQTAQYCKLTPKKNITLKNIRITNNNPTTNSGYSFRVDYGENIVIDRMDLIDCGGGVLLQDVYDFRVSNLLVDRLRNYSTAHGYGIHVVAGTCFGTISNYVSHSTRHAFTTLYEQRDSAYWGLPRHIKVSGVADADNNSFTVWDTHDSGYDIVFENCIAQGGGSNANGFQIRCPKTKLINCVSLYAGGRAISCTNGSDGCEILGGEYAYAGSNGISTRGNWIINGAHVHHSAGAGITIAGDYNEIRNCRINDNTNYGIQYSTGATNLLLIQNNYIPFSTGVQTAAVLNAPATSVISGNVMPGYTGAAALNTLDASAIVRNNIGFVTENSGTGSIASGATTATITHGCSRTPTVDDIQITFAEQGSNDYGRFWVDTITSTQFRVNVSADPGASNLDFGWKVEIL